METSLWTHDDRGGDGLEPDLMLPEQYFGALRRSSNQNGERRLMAAVLQEGIETFQKYATAQDPEGRELFADARSWILARYDQDLFSFTTVCATLEIDAECLRGGLLRWLDLQGSGSVGDSGAAYGRSGSGEGMSAASA
jgi:hypothetical protein